MLAYILLVVFGLCVTIMVLVALLVWTMFHEEGVEDESLAEDYLDSTDDSDELEESDGR